MAEGMIPGGLLAQIGRGLKLGGGVLNPAIHEQQMQERVQAEQQAQARKDALFQLIFAAAQEGAIPGDEARRILAAASPELAAQLPEGVIGPSARTQQAAAEYASKQQEQAATAQLAQQLGLPPGTPASTVNAMMRRQQSGGAASSLGKLAADYRNGLISKEEYEAARRKANYIAPRQEGAQPEGGFGTGLMGQAYNFLVQVETMRRNGQPIPQELQIKADAARSILSQPQLRTGPNGEMVSYTPGIPSFAGAQVQQPGASQVPGGGQIATIRTKEEDAKPDDALQAINDVADILNEAGAANETVTGVVGTAKRLGGGLARQAGMPVSPRAERLSRSLERLQAMVGPAILADSRLSDTERARVEQIVGTVSPQTDDVALRESLSDLARILSRISGKTQDDGWKIEVVP